MNNLLSPTLQVAVPFWQKDLQRVPWSDLERDLPG